MVLINSKFQVLYVTIAANFTGLKGTDMVEYLRVVGVLLPPLETIFSWPGLSNRWTLNCKFNDKRLYPCARNSSLFWLLDFQLTHEHGKIKLVIYNLSIF